MAKQQLTRAEGEHVTVINYSGGAEQSSLASRETDTMGWEHQMMFGESMRKHLAAGASSAYDKLQGIETTKPATTRAAQEVDALFLPILKYAGAAGGLYYLLPMVSGAIQGIGLVAVVIGGLWFMGKKR